MTATAGGRVVGLRAAGFLGVSFVAGFTGAGFGQGHHPVGDVVDAVLNAF